MAKIERKYMAHFINAASEGEAVYERLGQDLEEFSPELSAQVETRRNILGENSVVISGYEKTAAVEPFYAQQGKHVFRICFGCTGGRHRSVAAAEELAKRFIKRGYPVRLFHRDLDTEAEDISRRTQK